MTQGRGKRLGLLVLCLSGTLLFTSLCIWQIQRLAWKRDLIARGRQGHVVQVAVGP